MLKKYKRGDKIYIQGIRTWKQLVDVVQKAKAAGYSYLGYDDVPGIGYAAVFKKKLARNSKTHKK
jgi:hypothetical protein